MFASTHSEHLAGGHSRSVPLFSNMICSWICPHRLDGCYWFDYDQPSLAGAAAGCCSVVSSLMSTVFLFPDMTTP